MAIAEPENLGLALSGGGFRAMFFHLGVIRFLSEQKLLHRVRHITSVSGGSVLAAWLVQNWDEFLDCETKSGTARSVRGKRPRGLVLETPFDAAAADVVSLGLWDMRGCIQRRMFWDYCLGLIARAMQRSTRSVFERTTSGRLEKCLKKKLYGKATLRELGQPPEDGARRPELLLLTTGLNDFSLCCFSSKGHFHPKLGENAKYDVASIPVAYGVTTSAAFPTFFTPVPFNRATIPSLPKDIPESDANRSLADGGIFDNMGLRGLRTVAGKDDLWILSDASAAPRWQESASTFRTLRNTIRASDILMKRVHDLECEVSKCSGALGPRMVVVDIDEHRPVKIGAESSQDGPEPLEDALASENRGQLRYVRTDFDRFSRVEAHTLIQHGYTVAREQLFGCGAVAKQGISQPGANHQAWTPFKKPPRPDATELSDQLDVASRRAARLVAPLDIHSWATICALLVVLAATVTSAYVLVSTVVAIATPSRQARLWPPDLDILIGQRRVSTNPPWSEVEKYESVAARRQVPKPADIQALLRPVLSDRIDALTKALGSREIHPGADGKGPMGFVPMPNGPALVQETWTTTTAVAAMALAQTPSGLEPGSKDAKLVLGWLTELRDLFPKPSGTAEPKSRGYDLVLDDEGRLVGWGSELSKRKEHAGPLSWMLIALAVLDSRTGRLSEDRTHWEELWSAVWTCAKSYRGTGEFECDWRSFPSNASCTSPFACSLAIHALLEDPSRKLPGLDAKDRVQLAVRTGQRLEGMACHESGKFGWNCQGLCEIRSDAPVHRALTLQVVSSLLRLELTTGADPTGFSMTSRAQDFSRSLALSPPDKDAKDDKAQYTPPSGPAFDITHLYRPWEILCRWYFVRRMIEHGENGFAIRAALDRLVETIQMAEHLPNGTADARITFMISEELYALAELRKDIDRMLGN